MSNVTKRKKEKEIELLNRCWKFIDCLTIRTHKTMDVINQRQQEGEYWDKLWFVIICLSYRYTAKTRAVAVQVIEVSVIEIYLGFPGNFVVLHANQNFTYRLYLQKKKINQWIPILIFFFCQIKWKRKLLSSSDMKNWSSIITSF